MSSSPGTSGRPGGSLGRRRPMARRAALGLAGSMLLLLAASAAPLPAQSVRGTVTDGRSGEPVAGVFVSLHPVPDGARADGTLSGGQGQYALTAPVPGRYRIRVERIGYETWTSEPFELRADATLTRALEIGVQAVELEGLTVAVTGGCRSDPAEASAVGRIWREIRKALEPAAWAEREDRYRFRIVRYQRTVAPGSGRVVESRTWPEEEVRGRPFRSPPVERLVEEGFRQTEEDTTYFYGPDAEVLVSDAFAADHCFEIAPEDQAPGPGLVGLSFRPTEWWGSVDVEGTFWLSTDPVQLRELRFGYTGLSPDLPQGELGGRIGYRRLPDGGWIVEDWRLRMPRTVRQHMATTGAMARWFRGDRTRTRLAAIVETGGRVVRAAGPEGEARYAEGTAAVQGIATDSLGGGGPLEGARIEVEGTGIWTRSDSAGSFRLARVPAGTQRIVASVPELELAGLELPSTDLVVREDGRYFVDLATPSPETVRERACGPEEGVGGNAGVEPVALVGRVTGPDGTPVPGARVTAAWSRQSIVVRAEGEAQVSRTPTSREVRAGPDGGYLVCGLPGGTGITLEAEATVEGEGEEPAATLRGEASMELPAEGLARQDLVLGGGQQNSSIFELEN